jgi:4-hydroxy-3-methylbut-2-enyl diphosphate reductase
VVDATCPLVAKVHAEARRFAAQGSQVVLIGHAGHDEVTGTLGENPTIRLVETEADARALQLDAEGGVAVLTQTTMASDDVDGVLDTLRNRFPQLVQPAASDICYATQNRQDAVRDIARQCDLVVVVGSANSSNANRLVEVAERAGGQALLVEDVHQLSLTTLASASSLGVTAAASTPERLVTELLDALAGLGGLTMEERIVAEEEVHFNLPAGLR